MKDITVTYTNEATVNTGNFENIKPGYSASAVLEEGENVDTVREYLKSKVDAWLLEEIVEAKSDLKAK